VPPTTNTGGVETLVRVNYVEQVMGSCRALRNSWFRRANVEMAVYLARVSADNLGPIARSQLDRECGFASRCRSGNKNKPRLFHTKIDKIGDRGEKVQGTGSKQNEERKTKNMA
jgi:hypothetical protein